jgi:hypothetical protein
MQCGNCAAQAPRDKRGWERERGFRLVRYSLFFQSGFQVCEVLFDLPIIFLITLNVKNLEGFKNL